MKTITFEVDHARDCSCCANASRCFSERHARTDSGAPEKSGPLYDCHAVAQEVQARALKNISALATKLRMITDPNRTVGNLFAFDRSELSSEEPAVATDTEDNEFQGTVGSLFAFKRKR